MAQSIADIQAKSDAKRGVKSKSYKLPLSTIKLIEQLSNQTGKPQSAIITEAVKILSESLK
ncbi:hypothetical protein EI048_18555 [Escherichia coli]|uniref:hypothetical protein n=1 Tax=Escherichia coli TaxID=562 RepID=UPI000DD31D6F|nr:hypothetical protein [Escherichia coli]HCH8949294.1 hypothetical protein [Shigella flexneri]EAB6803390.1 hypothetical protein [Escherichia coli]EEX0335967.1 hypothetical protein [Escherichia coli]EEX0382702.1 hypothetical protein [Escherichia coli]EFF0540551.1 hypothetical protein [Escherichia coli]